MTIKVGFKQPILNYPVFLVFTLCKGFGNLPGNCAGVIRKGEAGGCIFSWEGFDEGDSVSGFGEFASDGDTLTGRIYFHDGDDSSFVARKTSGS